MAFGVSSSSASSLNHHVSSSSSTLSPLAAPFTVDRPRPNPTLPTDYGLFVGPVTVGPSSGGFFQAEPFYPQYGGTGPTRPAEGLGLDADGYDARSDLARTGPWNGPFDEGEGWRSDVAKKGNSSYVDPKGKGFVGKPLAISREKGDYHSTSWIDPSHSRFTSNYVGGTNGQDGVSSEAYFPFENSWYGCNIDTLVENCDFKSGYKEWMDDKPTTHIQKNASVPRLSVAQALPPASVSIPFPCSSGAISPMAVSSSYHNDCLIAEPSFGKSKENDVHRDVNFCSTGQVFPPVISRNIAFQSKDIQNSYLHVPPLNEVDSNDHNKGHMSSKIVGMNVSSKVEIKQCPYEKSKKNDEKTTNDSVPGLNEEVKPLKEKSGLDLSIGTDSLQSLSIIKCDSKVANFSVQTNVEHSNQISSEESDLSFGVDSPCWKGVSASRYTPFTDSTQHVSNLTGNEKLEESNKKGSNYLTVTPVKKYNFFDGVETKNALLKVKKKESPQKERGVISNEDESNSVDLKLPSSNRHSFTDIFSSSCARDDSFAFYPTNDGKISDSSFQGDCGSDKITDTSKMPRSSETLHEQSDAYYLVKSLYDTSQFLSSYCCNNNVLKEEGYDLLLMVIEKLDACFSKWAGLQGCQNNGKSSASLKVNCSRQSNEGLADVDPEKPHSLSSDVNNTHKFENNHMDFEGRNGITEIIEKSMKKIFCAEYSDTDLYKVRWIEAEAALCSAKCELYLSRINGHAGKCQPLADPQLTANADQESIEAHAPNQISMHELVGQNKLVAECKESFCTGSGEDNTQAVIPEKLQALGPSGIVSKSDNVDASVLSRLKILKDRTDKIDLSKAPQEVQDMMAIRSGLCGKNSSFVPLVPSLSSELNVGMQAQPSLTALKLNVGMQAQPSLTALTSNPWRFNSLGVDDDNAEVKNGSNMLSFGSNYHNSSYNEQYHGTSNTDKIACCTSFPVDPLDHGEFHFDGGSRSIIQAYLSNDVGVEDYYSSKYGSYSCDWEHVQKEELKS